MQLFIVVLFDVYYLSRSKSDVADDPPSKKLKCSEGKPGKKSYDKYTKNFQIKWAAKVPWVEGVVCKDGMINLAK